MAEQYPYGGVPQTLPNSSMSIVSLVTGILGITFVPFIGSIIALITGYMAKKEIRESNGALGGDGLATAGLVLGWIGVGLGVLGVCVFGAAIGIPFCIAIFASTSSSHSLLPLIFSLF